ncbi:MAG TPA: N-acetylmuramidase domain-containing protein [Allosphingosinicella sp.]|jgi:hypothetical protein
MADKFVGAGAPISEGGFASASRKLGNGRAALWALLAVETKGFGFLPDRRPKILFERHIFHRRTGGRYSEARPEVSNSRSGGYLGGADEYRRLERAMRLDRDAALESASWGLGQIMGFNAPRLGYPSAAAMIDAFLKGEDAQLDGCVRFIRADPALAAAFRKGDWPRVAAIYNGPSYAKNRYDVKLLGAHAAFKALPPKLDVRAAQARLVYLGYDPKGVDGLVGEATRTALRAFLKARGLPGDGSLTAAAHQALKTAAGV